MAPGEKGMGIATDNPLYKKRDNFSKTAYWFSRTMGLTLVCVALIVLRFVAGPIEWLGGMEAYLAFIDNMGQVGIFLGIPNAILAGTYSYGKKLDKEENGNGMETE